MKKILETIKSRKLLSTITILTLIAAIFGILFISLLSKENKELIINSITNFFSVIKNNQVNYPTTLFKSITNNLLLNLIIWLLGISIIGLPIVLIILSFDSFITSFTFTSILYTYNDKKLNELDVLYYYKTSIPTTDGDCVKDYFIRQQSGAWFNSSFINVIISLLFVLF